MELAQAIASTFDLSTLKSLFDFFTWLPTTFISLFLLFLFVRNI